MVTLYFGTMKHIFENSDECTINLMYRDEKHFRKCRDVLATVTHNIEKNNDAD